jgi:hypothetical protein
VRLHVADILRAGVEAHLASHRAPRAVLKAASAILACRTAVLGGHWGVCEAGHLSVWYNACRNRCCPRCAFYRVQRWLERQARLLLGCAHHHVVFTIPHELNPLWQLNQAALGDLLFASARDALFTLAADGRYLGALPGAIMALHTWGQQLSLHPHVHCLVTAGGADEKGEWRACRRRHFLPAEPLKQLFRSKWLDGLRQLVRRQKLRLPNGWTDAEVYRLGRQLQHKRWNVHVLERYGNPTAVLNYLGRYLHGGPIGEGRLVAFDTEKVSFRYKDYRVDKQDVMTLPTREFIRRYLQHVPPEHFHMIRGYGLYRRGSQNNHLRDRAAQAVPLSAEVRADLPSDQALSWRPQSGKTRCAICGVPVRAVVELRPIAAPPRDGPLILIA